MIKNDYLWWQTGVFYQIYPSSYRDTTGNGIGDLLGISNKLDYLNDILGIDAIWLSPFYPSPMKDFGYDVADYVDIHPLFGTLDDFDHLVEQAHQREIKIIIDWVPNHSSDQHPWFIESRSSRDNPKRDWYVWADPKPDGSPPNNWIAVFSGPAWEWDETTGQYYLHSFLKEQPDLNWRNPEVRQAMFEVIRFWLERGVDGFRVDVAHFIAKDPQMRDNPPAESAIAFHRPHGDYDTQNHLYDKGHPDTHQYYREFRALLDAYSSDQERMSVGEIHIFDWQEWATYYGSPQDGLEFHLPFNFSLLKTPWEAAAIRQAVDELEAALPTWAWPNYVLGNHDEGRIATRFGAEQARVAAMLLLTLRGTPTIYYGEEIGMTDVEIPIDEQLDPFGLRVPGWGRDRCRTPMQWSADPLAGFAPQGSKKLWLPLGEHWQQINVQQQVEAPRSHLSFYRQLLAHRKANPVLQRGGYQPLENIPEGSFVYQRLGTNQTITVALNFTGVPLKLPLNGRGQILLSTQLDRNGLEDLSALTLRENEGLIIQNEL
jgi:alpha-glucosidase